MTRRVTVEVAYAAPDEQALIELQVDTGSTVETVLELSGIYERFPRDNLRALDAGIWGRVVSRDTAVSEGDRVELYRPLRQDPREARRQRAG